MAKIDEEVINNLIIISTPFLKKNEVFKLIKSNKQIYHSLPLPDYIEVINEASHEKPLSKQMLKEAKSKKSNKKWISLAFFLVNLLIVVGIFVYQFSTGDAVSLIELFKLQPYYRYLFLALGIFFLINLLEALKFLGLVHRSTKNIRPILSYKVNGLGRYYDCVTPLSTGGQPFQMYYLKTRGVKTDAATAIPLVKYFFFQIAWIIICSCLLIFNMKAYLNNGYVVQIFAWISLILNIGLMSGVLLLSISKKIGPSIVIGGLKLLNKMHIIKNYKSAFKKVFKFVKEYQRSFKLLIKSPGQVIYHIILNGATILLNASLAFCVYLAFNHNGGFGIWEIITNVLICELATGMVPLPGAAGAAEISFAAVFGKYFSSQTLVWAMLFWRIFTYFGYILQGVIILVYDYAIGNKKANYYNQIKRFNGNNNYIPYRSRNKKDNKKTA